MALNTVVFPVAGLGTRFLPATKVIPKEMLPIVDRPLIQYAVEEAVAAGARRLVFVTGRTKGAIGDYFDKAYELETELARRGKDDLLAQVEELLPSNVECLYVRQPEALGLGHAILCARSLVPDESFGIILPDDLIDHPPEPALAQLARHHADTGASVISVEEVAREQTRAYGVVDVDAFEGRHGRLRGIVEKPEPSEAPSNLAVVGRYVLSSRIFELLEHTAPDHRGEIQITDAIAELLKEQAVDAYRFEGQHFDCGSKLGYLKATVHYGRLHPEVGPAFSEWLRRQ
ncbi:UTP--glucose-1-phosphate uridylyltransferase GalU [Wenzhouxiangella marina]|uniref:UTP--glucose-1-phosphate uridylyltransferase n=1 Tax=Wenzhouxiangella marina TaxID=1579979 RepID=A0A0K0XTB8_9GAMM|nr:UTP--glucose-1-phosphate uridylyltransferase GalU [Wenzhouxiangella marina]AKS40905.1 UTP-glucose-1-phosphate uridylyltransferase [Wenzhouxiangella marina]MBB6087779.1 UTP--glucose-1-phosphate uridylyltransferase [Wenzhouxiangella marina]